MMVALVASEKTHSGTDRNRKEHWCFRNHQNPIEIIVSYFFFFLSCSCSMPIPYEYSHLASESVNMKRKKEEKNMKMKISIFFSLGPFCKNKINKNII